jgi:hypothetical protein
MTTRTVYYADDDTYTVREAGLMHADPWAVQVWVRLDGVPTMVYAHQVKTTRSAAIGALIRFANERIAVGQEAHRALCRLKRDPDAPDPFAGAQSAGDVDGEFHHNPIRVHGGELTTAGNSEGI